MRISAVVQSLAADLVALGGLGDESTADVARRLAGAMEGPITARLIDSLSQIASELDVSLRTQRLEVRLVGGDAELVLFDEEEGGEPASDAGGDADARITLRLSSQLKTRVEQASAREGVSVNTYIVRVLSQQGRDDRGSRPGRRLRGYGQS